MPDTRQFVLAHFLWPWEFVEAASIQAAKALIRQRYPDAQFGTWGRGFRCINLPAWESPAVRLRYELGETEDKHKPVAYVMVHERRVKPDVSGVVGQQKRKPE